MARYELYLSTDRGTRLKLLDQAGGFQYARIANNLGHSLSRCRATLTATCCGWIGW